MNKLTRLIPLFFVALFFNLSCQKKEKIENKDLTLDEAKTYFQKNVLSIKSQTESTDAAILPKVTDWEHAIKKDRLGQGLAIPFKDSLFFSNNNLNTKSSSNGSYLLIYKDQQGKLHNEVVILMPSEIYKKDPSRGFTGKAFVHDWSGKFLKGYRYVYGKYAPIEKIRVVDRKNRNPDTEILKVCEYIDWYTCVSYGGDDWECHYNYTEEVFCDDPNEPFKGTTGGFTYIDPGGYPDPGHGGNSGIGGGSSNPEDRINTTSDNGKLSCKSFIFKRISGTANSQEAGIKGLKFVIDWVQGVPAKIFSFRAFYVSVGIKQDNGNVITAANAAVFAARAANFAGTALAANYFGMDPAMLPLLTSATVENEFRRLFEYYLKLEVNGYAGVLTNPTGSNTIVKSPVWNNLADQLINGLTGYDCDK